MKKWRFFLLISLWVSLLGCTQQSNLTMTETNPNLGKDADQSNIDVNKPEVYYFKGFQVFLCI